MFAAEEKNFRAAIAVKPTRLASIFLRRSRQNSAGMRWTPLDTHCQSKAPLTDCKHSKSVPLIRHFEQSLSSLANPCFALLPVSSFLNLWDPRGLGPSSFFAHPIRLVSNPLQLASYFSNASVFFAPFTPRSRKVVSHARP